MTLDKYSDDELAKEIKRREEEEKIGLPTPCLRPDFSKVIAGCEKHIQELQEGKVDRDTDHYIYEDAMQAIYGIDVWDWVNSKIK